MSDPLSVRRLADGSFEWLQDFGSEGGAQPVQGNAQQLAEWLQGRPATVLLPAASVLLLALELPVKSNNQIKQALPFALEDWLADELETCHWVWHKQQGKVYVAAVSHDSLTACLNALTEASVNVAGVYSEALALPYQEGFCSLLFDGGNVIFRQDPGLGGGIDAAIAEEVIAKLTADHELQGFKVWLAGGQAEAMPPIVGQASVEPLDSALALLQAGAAKLGAEANLLAGAYQAGKPAGWQWRQWLPAVAVVLLALALQTGALVTRYWQEKDQLSQLEAQTEALFKQTFPEVKRIVNIKAQAGQQLAELEKQSSNQGSRFMRMLFTVGQALAGAPGFQLKQLEFVNDSLLLQLLAPDISRLEQLKQQLETAQQLAVKIQSAEAGETSVEAHLEVREK
ncbi:MAG: type II secretion system protein GspL [Methylomonas sp.]|nr:MAG: type II secretion system protein GspL [Methylomonas sp.]